MTVYGIAPLGHRTAFTAHLSVWSSAFMSVFEAEGTTRDGAKSATFTDYSGERFRVILPDGITFPRTDGNYEEIDQAISEAYEAHNARLGRTQMGVKA